MVIIVISILMIYAHFLRYIMHVKSLREIEFSVKDYFKNYFLSLLILLIFCRIVLRFSAVDVGLSSIFEPPHWWKQRDKFIFIIQRVLFF